MFNLEKYYYSERRKCVVSNMFFIRNKENADEECVGY